LPVSASLGDNCGRDDCHKYVQFFFDLQEVCGVSKGLSLEARIELGHTGHSVKHQVSPFYNGSQRFLQRI
jgi:hypothetical protein